MPGSTRILFIRIRTEPTAREIGVHSLLIEPALSCSASRSSQFAICSVTGRLDHGRNPRVVREPAAVESLGGEVGAVAFCLDPGLTLAQEFTDLCEQLLRSRALALERLDSLEPAYDCPRFVHAPKVTAESGPDRAGFVTIMRQP